MLNKYGIDTSGKSEGELMDGSPLLGYFHPTN